MHFIHLRLNIFAFGTIELETIDNWGNRVVLFFNVSCEVSSVRSLKCSFFKCHTRLDVSNIKMPFSIVHVNSLSKNINNDG